MNALAILLFFGAYPIGEGDPREAFAECSAAYETDQKGARPLNTVYAQCIETTADLSRRLRAKNQPTDAQYWQRFSTNLAQLTATLDAVGKDGTTHHSLVVQGIDRLRNTKAD